MKKLLAIVCILAIGFNAHAKGKKNANTFGKAVKVKKAVSVTELVSKVTETKIDAVVKGTVQEVCKAEGCWLKMEDGKGGTIFVKMKNHEFTVPKDIDGKTVIVQGLAAKSITSVEMLKHLAEDAGKTKEQIEAIKEPKVEIKIEATGVVVL
jgi:hypothetical protein